MAIASLIGEKYILPAAKKSLNIASTSAPVKCSINSVFTTVKKASRKVGLMSAINTIDNALYSLRTEYTKLFKMQGVKKTYPKETKQLLKTVINDSWKSRKLHPYEIEILAPELNQHPQAVNELLKLSRFDGQAIKDLVPLMEKYPQSVKTLASLKNEKGHYRFYGLDIKELAEIADKHPDAVIELSKLKRISTYKDGEITKLGSDEILKLAPAYEKAPEEVKTLLNETKMEKYPSKEIRKVPRFDEDDISKLAPVLKEEPELVNELLKAAENGEARFYAKDICSLVPLLKKEPKIVRDLLKDGYNAQQIKRLIPVMKERPSIVSELSKMKGNIFSKTGPRFDKEDISLVAPEMLRDPVTVEEMLNSSTRAIFGNYTPDFSGKSISTIMKLIREEGKNAGSLYPKISSSTVKFVAKDSRGKVITQEVKTAEDVVKYLKSFSNQVEDKDINGLTKLFEAHPQRFNKIANSGLFELIDKGYINKAQYKRLFPNTRPNGHDTPVNQFITLSNRTLSEIKTVKEHLDMGKVPSLVKDIKNEAEKYVVSIGDVFQHDGKLFVRESEETFTPLKLSKEKFDKLFPPLSSAFNQGQVGDCWLVSAIDNMLDNPKARAEIFKAFEQNGDDIIIKIGYEKSNFPNGIVVDANGKQINGADGIKMLEQHFADKRSLLSDYNADGGRKRLEDLGKIDDTSKFMDRLHGGLSKHVWEKFYRGGENTLITGNKDIMERVIKTNNPDRLVQISFSSGVEREELKDFNLFSRHAYALKSYSPKKGTIQVTNPWNTSTVIEVPLETAVKYVEVLDILKIA